MSSQRRKRRAWFTFLGCAFLAAGPALSGPPYFTDDPEPVPLHHWELYLAATRATDEGDRAGDVPHFEVNLGAAPNLQLHLIVPVAYARAAGGGTTRGLGDIETGAKFRFVEETEGRPQIGTFPLVEVPTGDAGRGLGAGHVRVFLPVWLQKSFGKLATYGGGGYWVNPGQGNRNWWYAGWQAQLQLTPFLAPGAEVFYQTAQTDGGHAEVHFNLGLIVDLGESHHVLVSAGRAVHGCDCAHVYVSYLLTLGPKS